MNTKGHPWWKPKLNKKITSSGGSQMQDVWIVYNLKLEFSKIKAMDIIDSGYERILIGVSKESEVIFETLDRTAKKTKNIIAVVR